MKTLFLDCFAGISGDMFVGALLDLGVDFKNLQEQLQTVPVNNYQIAAEKVIKNGITGTKFSVFTIVAEKQHRHLHHIHDIIDKSGLSASVKRQAKKIFSHLAEAEAKIHGITPDKVHFHEVGAVDSIIDILSVLICLEHLAVEEIICSPLPMGKGFVQCAHGIIPLPAPATLELLHGYPVTETDIEGETVTPTGAVLAVNLAKRFGPFPAMSVEGVGYGAGTRNGEIPNLLRVVLGQTQSAAPFQQDKVSVITATIDDMNPEFYDYVMNRLFTAGALDVTLTPLQMKKNRPGQQLTVLCPPDRLNHLANIILRETTSLGVRVREETRFKLKRELKAVETPFGPVMVKLGKCPATQKVWNIAPEWEDCRLLAEKHGVPAKTVYDQAKSVAMSLYLGNDKTVTTEYTAQPSCNQNLKDQKPMIKLKK
ncbi:nickel pincer cofactor biosynthesis protein LarC [Thermincola ferriacetica]